MINLFKNMRNFDKNVNTHLPQNANIFSYKTIFIY